MKRMAAAAVLVCAAGVGLAHAQDRAQFDGVAPVTHTVEMVLKEGRYAFEPKEVKAKAGDRVVFVMASGGPHNVAFDPATIPADQKDQLWANMPGSMDGSSPIFTDPNQEWTLSIGNIAPGKYPFHCTPHLAMNMKGEITVQ